MRLRLRHRPGSRQADLAPLVDVALLLVVFLLLTSEAIDDRELPVQLPEASTATEAIDSPDLELTIMQNGAVYAGTEEVGMDALTELAGGRSRAVLRIDKRCPHGEVVAVIDALRLAGVQEIVERTESSNIEEW